MAAKNTKEQAVQSIELQLQKLEEIVSNLEDGEIPLEESLKLFEEGVTLYKSCKKKMNSIELKIQKLTDSMREEPLDENE